MRLPATSLSRDTSILPPRKEHIVLGSHTTLCRAERYAERRAGEGDRPCSNRENSALCRECGSQIPPHNARTFSDYADEPTASGGHAEWSKCCVRLRILSPTSRDFDMSSRDFPGTAVSAECPVPLWVMAHIADGISPSGSGGGYASRGSGASPAAERWHSFHHSSAGGVSTREA